MKILIFLFLLLTSGIATSQNPQSGNPIDANSIKNAEWHSLDKGVKRWRSRAFNISFRSFSSRTRRLKQKLDLYLKKHPTDVPFLWVRSDIFFYLENIDSMIIDYKAIIAHTHVDNRGSFAQNFSYTLISIVEKGGLRYKVDCCFFNKIRIEKGLWVQTCMAGFVEICGCKKNN